MGTLSLIGGWICHSALAIQVWFVIHLFRTGQRKKHPAFVWFMTFYLAESIVLLVLFLADKSISRQMYANVFWSLRGLEIIFLAWTAGQLWRKEWLVLAGVAVAVSQTIHFHLWADRWYGFLLCATMLLILAVGKLDTQQRSIALGLFLMNVFLAIIQVPQVYRPGPVHDVLRYVPDASMLLAQSLWIRSFRLLKLKPT